MPLVSLPSFSNMFLPSVVSTTKSSWTAVHSLPLLLLRNLLAFSHTYDIGLSTAYHPQTDGKSEQVNQELENYLRIFCQGQPIKWADLLPIAEFLYNSAIHSIVNQILFLS